jgi:hypothetical protein
MLKPILDIDNLNVSLTVFGIVQSLQGYRQKADWDVIDRLVYSGVWLYFGKDPANMVSGRGLSVQFFSLFQSMPSKQF